MPRGDRTGPAGAGPMTGRGMGFCAGYHQPGYATGSGFGRGTGRGFRNRRFAGWRCAPHMPADAASKEEQVAALKEQISRMQQQIAALEETE